MGEPTVEELLSDELIVADGSGTGTGSAGRVSNDPSSIRAVTYNLDKAGNRTSVVDTGVSTTYTPNNLNQYTGVGGTNNVTNGLEHEIASYQNINYTYVNDEHLNSVTYGNRVYLLAYDALGRCAKRTIRGVTNYYVYDGEKPILEYSSTAAVLARNLYGKGIDEILMRVDLTNNWTLYYQNDHEGSVTHLTGTAGTVLEKYRYDAFGAPTIYDASGNVLTATAWNNRFLFTGREYRSTFGIYEYRARAYHPGLGRFMSEDPKLFDAGDYNLFRYCHNDPLDVTDAMGLMGNIWWRNMTPEVYARMMSEATRKVLDNNPSAGAINIGMASLTMGLTVTGQGGHSQGTGLGRSQYPPAIEAAQFPLMKDATDKSAEAMHNDPEGYPYSVGNGTLGQGRPARGTRYVAAGHEYFREPATYYGKLLSVGHVHKPGTSKGFSGSDTGSGVPIMKNRDGYIRNGTVEQYDLYYRGWRWYYAPDMSTIMAGPMRY